MSNEVGKKTDLRNFISSDKVKNEIAKALPSLCKPETFIRVAMTAMTKNPKLLQCDQNSFVTALLDCAALGIEPDGRKSYLIPYGKTCQLIVSYMGLIELVRRSGEIVMIHADKVCEHDIFKTNMGEITEHTIDYAKERGEPYAYYAYAKMKDGSKQTQVMTKAEVDKIRAISKSSGSGPWKDHYDSMALKTVFRRLAKWLPMSSEVATKLQEVEEKEFDFEMPTQEEPQKLKSDLL